MAQYPHLCPSLTTRDAGSSSTFKGEENPTDCLRETSRVAPAIGISPKIIRKLNGLMVVGDTWNIVRIDGIIQLFNQITVASKPAIHYKGLPVAFQANCRYEIEFAEVDNCTLSLLITSVVDKSTYEGILGRPVIYKYMCNAFLNIIKDSMKASRTLAWARYLVNLGSGITIKQKEWEVIGNLVADRLRNHDSRNEHYGDSDVDDENSETPGLPTRRLVFPDGAKFCFLLKMFEQDTPFEEAIYPNHYPHIRINHSSITRVIVHVAHDYTLEKDLLFFNKKFYQHLFPKLAALPTHEYNVGILPKASNYVYMNMPANSFNVAGMTQNTRLFQEVDLNPNGFFRYSVIAKAMFNGYISKLNQTSLWRNPSEDQALAALRRGTLKCIAEGVLGTINSSWEITARCEFVWAYDVNKRQNKDEEESVYFHSFVDVLQKAFQDCSQFKTHFEVCNLDFFTVYKRRIVMTYLRNLATTLFRTILSSLEKLESLFAVKEEEKLHDASAIFTDQFFANVAVAEAMLAMFLLGEMNNFPELLENFIIMKRDLLQIEDGQEQSGILHPLQLNEKEDLEDDDQILRDCWPFKRCDAREQRDQTSEGHHGEIFTPHEIIRSEADLLQTNIPLGQIISDF